MSYKPFVFQEGFKLGVATASTQIEGNMPKNNWTQLASIDGAISDHSSPNPANDHYRLYKEDIDMMAQMGIKYYRMSLEWGRIEPDDGLFVEKEIQHYINEIKYLQSKGIEPLVTLHHFSNPQWFENKGGFLNKDAVKDFIRYVDYVACRLKGLVKNYCTINEPNIYATNSYLYGTWMPRHKKVTETIKVISVLSQCHCKAYKILKQYDPECQVGYAMNVAYFAPSREDKKSDINGAKLFDAMFQTKVLKVFTNGGSCFPYNSKSPKGDYADFVGLNYYLRMYMKGFTIVDAPKDAFKTDFGWDVYPDGLRQLVIKYHDLFKKDIYITENGIADKSDCHRPWYLYEHLYAIHDLEFVKGYYHWTFIDNWEWASGHDMKFGLIELDVKTQNRSIRKSGLMYSNLIASNGFTKEIIKKYI